MSLKSVYDFLNDEILVIDKKISLLEEQIKMKNISIDESKIFIDDLKKNDNEDSLFSPLYIEEKKNINLSHEEENIASCEEDIRNFSKQLSELLVKKDDLKKQMQVIEGFTKNQTVIAFDTLNLLKDNNKYVSDEMNSIMENFNKCLESFIYVDPRRVIVEYKTFQERINTLQKRLDSNNELIERISK